METTVPSTQRKVQYMVHKNTHWKVQYMAHESNVEIQCKFADLRDGTDSHVTALWTFDIVKGDTSFLLYRLQTLVFVINPRGLHSRLAWQELRGNFYG